MTNRREEENLCSLVNPNRLYVLTTLVWRSIWRPLRIWYIRPHSIIWRRLQICFKNIQCPRPSCCFSSSLSSSLFSTSIFPSSTGSINTLYTEPVTTIAIKVRWQIILANAAAKTPRPVSVIWFLESPMWMSYEPASWTKQIATMSMRLSIR